MTIVVLLILAVLWAAMLVPPYLRNRAEARPADSIGAFRRQMSTISRTTPSSLSIPFVTARRALVAPPVAVPVVRRAAAPRANAPTRARSQKRRRDVFAFLLAAMVISLALSLLAPMMLLVHLVVDVLFAVNTGVIASRVPNPVPAAKARCRSRARDEGALPAGRRPGRRAAAAAALGQLS